MEEHTMSRKSFLKNSAIGIAGVALGPSAHPSRSVSTNSTAQQQHTSPAQYWLKNVRLETGFTYQNDQVVSTRTALFCIEIKDGKIAQISPQTDDKKAIDMGGLLMLPSFRDMHIHLDKTYYGGHWQAVQRPQNGVKGMIALEQQILPELLKTSTYKAEKLIELLQSKGTAFARSHVNVEPTSKLQSLKNLQQALENKKEGFQAEIVAFPQHGVYYTDSAEYMREAASMDIDFIGGLDPNSIDGQIEKTMDFTLELALAYNKGIDIHLHESGDSGLKTVEYLIKQVNENPVLKGKTFLSHCFVLGKLDKAKEEEIADKLAEAQIGIISTIPFGGLIMPIPTLLKRGVQVMSGNDSIVDHWNTFGSGSVLEKANLAAQLYGYSSEFGLSRMLTLATAGKLPLDDAGQQQWPRTNDPADLVFVDASCSAEAVSRVSQIRSLVHKGKFVY